VRRSKVSKISVACIKASLSRSLNNNNNNKNLLWFQYIGVYIHVRILNYETGSLKTHSEDILPKLLNICLSRDIKSVSELHGQKLYPRLSM
jgi:hypothetical protein